MRIFLGRREDEFSLSFSLSSLYANSLRRDPARERFIRILALRLGSSAPRAQLSTAQRIRFGIVREFHPATAQRRRRNFSKNCAELLPNFDAIVIGNAATSVIPGVGLPLFGKNKGRDVVLFSFRRISRRKCGKIVAAQFRSLFPRGIFERRWPTRYCSSLCPENYT